ncbi:YIP1 family protein [Natronospora cellulosivora (SeqCode)]
MRKKLINYSFSVLLLLLILFMPVIQASARTPYPSYIYDFFSRPVSAPQSYIIDSYFTGDDLGVGALRNPEDIHTTDDSIYLLDSGNHRIIVMNESFELVDIISEFYRDGEKDTFNNPRGIFVNDDGIIFLADTNNARILVLDQDLNLINQIDEKSLMMDDLENLIEEDFSFRPRKIVVNSLGRIMVLAQDIYDGILVFEDDGTFSGFVGAPRVSPSVFDIFWMRFGTEEQRARRQRFLPIEYSNITVDNEGYIIAVEAGSADEESIKRLNPAGTDRMTREGVVETMGDVGPVLFLSDDPDVQAGMSANSATFRDVISREHGIFSVLDSNRGRIFTYDGRGELLYVFGGTGSHIRGLFNRPRGLEYFNENYLVLDADGYLTVFRPTVYASLINQAIDYYNTGRYDLSKDTWREALDYNSNYHIAYNGIGRSLLRDGYYEEAMEYFKLGQNREYYSQAYSYYRRDRLEENLNTVFTVFILTIIFIVLGIKFNLFKKFNNVLKNLTASISETAASVENSTINFLQKRVKETLRALKYSLYVIIHPIKGFWDLKHEKKGNISAALVILFLAWFSIIYHTQYSAFIFNTTRMQNFNIMREFFSFFVPVFLWCMVNWALTTLMEGKGTFKEVCIATSYALVPIILTFIPATFLTNVLLYTEAEFITMLLGFGIIWSGALVFLATLVTHEYLLLKTAFTTVLIIMGMGVVLFLSALFLTIVNHSIVFFTNIYSELILR